MASSRNEAHFPGLGGGTATNISTDAALPPGTAAAGSTGEVSDAGHIHRHSYLSELNAWGVPAAWNANTNSPALASGVANATNTAFIVSTAGSTTLDGITSWVVGDVAYFDGASTTWKKLSADAFEPSTWALRSTGTYVGQKKWITDVGGNGAGSVFIWDGTYWRPMGGRLTVLRRYSTIASPLATLTGITASLFTLPDAIALPADLIPIHGAIEIQANCRRTSGTNATADFEAYLGTAGTSSDSIIGRVVVGNATNHVAWMMSRGIFGTSRTTCVATGTSQPQNSNAASSFTDRTTNINAAAAMSLNLGLAAANAGDAFALVSYEAILIG